MLLLRREIFQRRGDNIVHVKFTPSTHLAEVRLNGFSNLIFLPQRIRQKYVDAFLVNTHER
jgi:hypothetical protein